MQSTNMEIQRTGVVPQTPCTTAHLEFLAPTQCQPLALCLWEGGQKTYVCRQIGGRQAILICIYVVDVDQFSRVLNT